MTIRIQPSALREIKAAHNGKGLRVSTLKRTSTYSVVSGSFGTDSYQSVAIREGLFKRLCKQHRSRNNGFLLIRHGYAHLSL